jgi:hypothetical protein
MRSLIIFTMHPRYILNQQAPFSGDDNIAEIRGEVWRFHELGAGIVFGTDTGYLTDYDVGEEFARLANRGFRWSDILHMLSENPARLFKDQKNRGGSSSD